MTQRDSRISLTDDERETLGMMFVDVEKRIGSAEYFEVRLARAKVARLKVRFFPKPKQKEPSNGNP